MNELSVNIQTSIRDSMKLLDKTGLKCLIVVGDNNELIGTLTDGDIRRGILNGLDFGNDIQNCYHTKPISMHEGQYTDRNARELMIENQVTVLPIVDRNNVLVDYVTINQITNDEDQPLNRRLEAPVVIMAGGRGTRLEPFSSVLPKPLIPLRDKTIIEHVIDKFTKHGSDSFYITVNYKSRIIKSFFEDLAPPYSLIYIDEDKPLGTAGSLSKLRNQFTSPIFVTNCDILVDIDYSSLYDFHIKNENDLTLVSCQKKYIIPYGVCILNSLGDLEKLDEKPEYQLLTSTGLYVLNPNILELIQENCVYQMNDLITDSKNKGFKIGVYPIDEDAWMDIGEWSEYEKAVRRL